MPGFTVMVVKRRVQIAIEKKLLKSFIEFL